MPLPRMAGTIERRLLVNYAVDPDVLRPLVPERFRLQQVGGAAVAGICLIRLGGLRPAGLPVGLGLTTENGAHRVAVEWDSAEGLRRGVYILRRDTDSRVTTVVGGRLFPGTHDRAVFDVTETAERLQVAYRSVDGRAQVGVDVQLADELRGSQLFAETAVASAFFEQGAVGYSPSRRPQRLEGLEIRTSAWRVEATTVTSGHSSLFDDTTLFPNGSAVLDSALVMRNVPVTWHAVADADAPRRVPA
jgi:hypothetical protein